jgi:Proteasome subunit
MDLHLWGGRVSSEAWQSSSFHDFLSWHAPDLLPAFLAGPRPASRPVAPGFSHRGISEERRFHTIGSGSVFASGALKKLYTENMSAEEAVLCCVQALFDAADDDSATGGPDMARRIYPVAATSRTRGSAVCPTPRWQESRSRLSKAG